MVYNRQQTIMKRHLLTLFLALAVSVGTLFAQSGTCGTNLTWTLDTESGILTISGTGAMKDYTYSSKPNTPWYSYRESIASVVISDGVASIGTYAFYGCSSLTSITIPSSVTTIGNYAFNYCSSLTSLTIGESVTSIGSYAFRGCSSLTSVIWNAKKCNDFSSFNTSFYYYKSGSSYNFDHRKQITSFTFGDDVESIPAYLCSGMSNLTYITIPNSVTIIGSFAFNDCGKITSDLNLSSVTSIGECAFRNCSNITSDLNLNNVETIGQQAFLGCSSLTKVVIGDGATSIGERAFSGCTYLEDITIGSSINVENGIGQYAFIGCRYLLSVTCKAVFPPALNANVFEGCGVLSKIDLYVPEESIKKYQKAEVWSEFNIIGKNLDDSNIDAVENIFYNQDTHDLYKYLRNGLLFIERNGITYTAQGQRID